MKIFLRTNQFRKILAKKCKSQNWLAKRLNISSGYISQLMCGTRNPSPELREKMLELLKDYNFDSVFKIKN